MNNYELERILRKVLLDKDIDVIKDLCDNTKISFQIQLERIESLLNYFSNSISSIKVAILSDGYTEPVINLPLDAINDLIDMSLKLYKEYGDSLNYIESNNKSVTITQCTKSEDFIKALNILIRKML